jgi:serine protease Do
VFLKINVIHNMNCFRTGNGKEMKTIAFRQVLPNHIGAILTALMMLAALALTTGPVAAKSAPADGFADLAEKLLPSVVNISTTQVIEGRSGPQVPQLPPGSPFEDFFKEFFDRNQGEGGRARKATSLGSGFFFGNEGYVVTNNHVIQDADEIAVILQDDTRLKAELIGRDQKSDLAVLKVKTDRKIAGVKFGNSDKSRVGDWVVAIGNPFGLGGTVTAGIISARGRDINAGPYDDFIQTDASINRGNSGGPMFNLDGEVVGVNTAIYSPSGGSVGIGFAIPSSAAGPVVKQLIDNGEVKRGWLGVHIQQVTDEIAESLGLKKPRGALVADVIKDGPAQAAKIEKGDVILRFDNKPVREMRSLPKIVADTVVGKPVEVVVWRSGSRKTLQVTVGVLDDATEVAAKSSRDKKGLTRSLDDLGMTLMTLTDDSREHYKLSKEAKGVLVSKVTGEGPAAEKGVRPGDLIVEVSQEEVSTPTQVVNKVKEAQKADRKTVLFLIEGQNGLRFVALRIGKE